MGARSRARRYALQMLFQLDLTGEASDDARAAFWSARRPDPAAREFAEHLVAGVREAGAELDEVIVEAAENWRVERIATVERNVLRLAVFELMQEKETPAAVVIDEAIELAKRYGGGDSGAFINGVLDAVRRRLEARGAER